MQRTATVEFAPNVARHYPATLTTISSRGRQGRETPLGSDSDFSTGHRIEERERDGSRPPRRPSIPPNSRIPVARYPTTHTNRSARSRRASQLQSFSTQPYEPPNPPLPQKHSGFGGFPMPHEILAMILRWLFPGVEKRLHRTVTIPVTTTLTGGGLGRTVSLGPGGRTYSVHGSGLDAGGSISGAIGEDAKPVAYISFDAIVGRNSAFHLLTNEQLEELGGVEYRALNALLWLVAGYHLGSQLISFIVIAPYISRSEWKSDFVPPQLFKPVSQAWFSIFQVVSAYTNTGTSLVDQSMVPFQTAYPMIFFMIFCILAGNTAFPIFFRLLIWIISKLVPSTSRAKETLHFLLDHPRRCFIYLFPSHQTWFLLTVLLMLNLTDWFFFMVLDIGNPAIESIPLGTRFVAGLLQAVAVRAAGFGIVTLAALSPAVKVMYVVMMYISVYPIALSVRSTNVYEEQSLGIYRDDDESEEEQTFPAQGPRMTVWSRYLAMHARKQLAFDMWWLALALFLVCIIERGNLNDSKQQSWFNIFTIIFELVSAYGTVGLSLGQPAQNYSFSGALSPLSKLIICIVMLRGRHRGLPVAIDRAVMLPSEFQKTKDDPDFGLAHDDRQSARRLSRHFNMDGPLDAEDPDYNNPDINGKANSGEYDETENGMEERLRRVVGGKSSQDAMIEAGREKAHEDDKMMST
ncbi:hypothetical protein SERLA73DRAFT_105229 [Serpula lacrymans var. lacrymans S7.3]|uniref:Potassium transport protein n=1 Tax=Serpula lacrymans var. lacrymans (strain S7.3) TaxID=936435 RepID=F8PSW3_SERL3|nr:hypothetical protein SERLA73DRAFT_105229 [Serpula lacrymans var. lacrymans S7.3]